MVLGKLPVPGRPTILITVGHGPTALAVGAGGGCLDIFSLVYPFSPLSPSLLETVRYRLKYCLIGSLNPKQSINQSPPPYHRKNITGFGFFVKIHLLESSKLDFSGLYFRSFWDFTSYWQFGITFLLRAW